MTSSHEPAGLVWATRGRAWGFRFLLTGGLTDPLPEYERVLAELGDARTGYCRVAGKVGLRLPDPQGRRDASGRVIPHEFVLSGSLAEQVGSVEEGLKRVWPLVADFYDKAWSDGSAPSELELRSLRLQLADL